MSGVLRVLDLVAPLLLAEALWAIAVIGGCALLFDMRLTVPLEKGETFTLLHAAPSAMEAGLRQAAGYPLPTMACGKRTWKDLTWSAA